MKLSACVIACDEQDNIERCLRSLRFADELVVVDSGSIDGTVEVAQRYADRVIHQPWLGYGKQKNFAIDQTQGEWVLSIDADEWVTAELRDEILGALEQPSCEGYRIPRRGYFAGRWMRGGGWYPDYQLRLFRREAGRFSERAVHETVELRSEPGDLQNPLMHYCYPTLDDYVETMRQYSTLGADELEKRGRRAGGAEMLVRAAVKFLVVYLRKQGWRDGTHGLIFAALSSTDTFLRYAKLWERTCTREPVDVDEDR